MTRETKDSAFVLLSCTAIVLATLWAGIWLAGKFILELVHGH